MSVRRRRVTGETAENEAAPGLGKTIQRLRKAYNMSLGELSEQSGVAKSIISQIERNETNPTISTVWRLSKALDITLDEVLKTDSPQNFLQHQTRAGVPTLTSEDGLCTLHIIGALDLVEMFQVYDFHAKPGGTLESEPHQQGCVEHLSVLKGTLSVTIEGETRDIKMGETLRYRGDRSHKIANTGLEDAQATMVVALRVPVIEERRS
ncbi:transcriptional regulator with XRE-family HTH domain [Rhodoligotrophos appendicifer]|uniref:helix-turn-helix domain-containing protein n=1 Tax=Rhodoligotrophos appendicifer TaxID=987056 RepID=UPI001185F01E|nr:XRE family transcriptional regulator [Rhodoligotrophos appendicifer]